MPHDVSLISTIAAGVGLAMILGLLAARVRPPPLVGYLLAGVLVSPATSGYVADVGLAGQLAEIGVMLLTLGVGLHFSRDDLMAVKKIAVPGAIVQIGGFSVILAALGVGLGMMPAERQTSCSPPSTRQPSPGPCVKAAWPPTT